MAQELLPTASSQFASAGYWTRFFETRQGRAFEWYLNSDALCEVLLDALPPSASCCLHLGCGSSQVATQWRYTAGDRPLIFLHSDYVPVAVAEALYGLRAHVALGALDLLRDPAHEFVVHDAKQMPVRDDVVDVALSKGLVDAMFHDDGSSSVLGMQTLLREVSRVLKSGGLYLMVSLLQDHTRRLLEKAAKEDGRWEGLSITPLQPPMLGELRPFLVKLRKRGRDRDRIGAVEVDLGFETAVKRYPSGLQAGLSFEGEADDASLEATGDWETLWTQVESAQHSFDSHRQKGKAGRASVAEEKQTVCSVRIDFMPRTQTVETDLQALRFQLLLLATQNPHLPKSVVVSGLLGWAEMEIQPLAFGLSKLCATAIIDPSMLQPEDFLEAMQTRFEMPEEDGLDEDLDDGGGETDAGVAASGDTFSMERVKSISMVDVRFGDVAGT